MRKRLKLTNRREFACKNSTLRTGSAGPRWCDSSHCAIIRARIDGSFSRRAILEKGPAIMANMKKYPVKTSGKSSAAAAKPGANSVILEGKKAPAFSLPDQSGE